MRAHRAAPFLPSIRAVVTVSALGDERADVLIQTELLGGRLTGSGHSDVCVTALKALFAQGVRLYKGGGGVDNA